MAKTRRRKKRTHVEETPDPSRKKEPRTFVFRRGKQSAPLADLEMDVRRMMQPNTAMNLRETRRNVIKDFVQVAGPLGVSHFIFFTRTEKSSYLRIAKTPRGPTLTLKIHNYSLMRDVQSVQAKPRMPQAAFKSPPLVVLNGFTGHEHLKLATTLFQGMFPAINVRKVKLSSCQRVVLLARDKDTGLLSLRHYTINVLPSGVRKSLKVLLAQRQVPDLGNFADVSEFLTKSGYGSESEGEEAEASRVTLGQDLGKGNTAGHASRVRLHEIGPRLELEVLKVEDGLCDGRVLFHAYEARTAEEAAALQAQHERRATLKDTRRRQQEDNVKRKQALKKLKEEKAAAEKAAKSGRPAAAAAAGTEAGRGQKRSAAEAAGDEDDDVQYFEQEVGHAPEDTDMVRKGGTHVGSKPPSRGVRGGVQKKQGAKGSHMQGRRDGGRKQGFGGRGGGRGAGRQSGRGRGGPPNKKQRRG